MAVHRKTGILDAHSHVVAPDFDGFCLDRDEHDGARVLGIGDLIPAAAFGRRGRWRITVEFEPTDGPELSGQLR